MGPTPWTLLHDALVVGLVRRGGDVDVQVSAPHLASRFDRSCERFVLRLVGTQRFTYRPYGDDSLAIDEFEAIVRAAPQLVEAVIEGDDVVIWGSRGSLRLSYSSATIHLESGAEVSVDQLESVVTEYWREWRARHPRT